MNFAKLIALSGCLLLASGVVAQAPANPGPGAPVSYASVSELNQLIGNLQSASQSTQQDLSHLRIERWKVDSNTKRQTQSDTESLLKNLQNALPGILSDLKNSPENLALTFKTYRNLDALYDVLNSVVESAGARSEEHTSELQSRRDLVCRLLLEKKKKKKKQKELRKNKNRKEKI